MADSHLNGAYYGPAIPPPAKSYNRRSRSSGGCGCGCLSCCGCCLLKCLFQILLTIALILAIIALITWLIFRPNIIKFNVTDAHLTQFNVTNTNMLHHKLSVDISIRNPNRRVGVYYDSIEARAYYGGERFGSVALHGFYQGHKNTSVLSPTFQGQQLVVLGKEFQEDKAAGMYDIDVKLYLKVRFKMGVLRSPKFKPKIRCDIRLPLGRAAGVFKTERCQLDF